MRERSVPAPLMLCPVCGASWWSNIAFQGTDEIGATIDLSANLEMQCQVCGSMARAVRPPRSRIAHEIVTALKAADLSPDDLREISSALNDDPSISPRQLAKQVPQATGFISVTASKLGAAEWIAILSLIVTITLWSIDKGQDQQAPVSPNPPAPANRTSQLTDDDVTKIATRVERDIRARRDAAKQEAPRGRGDDDEPEHRKQP